MTCPHTFRYFEKQVGRDWIDMGPALIDIEAADGQATLQKIEEKHGPGLIPRITITRAEARKLKPDTDIILATKKAGPRKAPEAPGFPRAAFLATITAVDADGCYKAEGHDYGYSFEAAFGPEHIVSRAVDPRRSDKPPAQTAAYNWLYPVVAALTISGIALFQRMRT